MSLYNFERTLIDRVEISRLQKTQDAYGGYTTTPKTVARNIPARIYGSSGTLERLIAGKTYRANMKMMATYDADIQVGDIIIKDDGNQYLVIWKREYRVMSELHHLTVELATYSEIVL